MLVWLIVPFYDFCGFWSVAINNVHKLQFFYIYQSNFSLCWSEVLLYVQWSGMSNPADSLTVMSSPSRLCINRYVNYRQSLIMTLMMDLWSIVRFCSWKIEMQYLQLWAYDIFYCLWGVIFHFVHNVNCMCNNELGIL